MEIEVKERFLSAEDYELFLATVGAVKGEENVVMQKNMFLDDGEKRLGKSLTAMRMFWGA